MGYIRFFLASLVLVGHFAPADWWSVFITTDAAVQGFFMVSGFYMFLVLEKKYGDLRTFYVNRVLRIYPSYLFILVCAVVASLTLGAGAHYVPVAVIAEQLSKLDAASAILIVFANVAIVFLNAVSFLHVDGGSLAWTPAYKLAPFPAFKLLVIPQAWSVDLELMFYAIVPFLVRLKSRYIVALILISFAGRVWFYSWGAPFHRDPWSFRFFPFELALFLTGGLLYRVARDYGRHFNNPRLAWAMLIFLVVYGSSYAALPSTRLGNFQIRYDVFMIALACSLPFLHCSLSYGGANQFLGDLSYPIYLNHLFVFNLLATLPFPGSKIFFVVGSICSIGLAILMVRWIEDPIDRYRQALVRRQGAVTPAPAAATVAPIINT